MNDPSDQTILLVEDDANEVFLFERAFRKAELTNPLCVARDGQEVIDYLAGNGEYSDRTRYPLPSLLLLDLKMPKLTGFDVLAWLGTRPDLNIHAVVLSSSSYPEDIPRAKKLGAREYFIQPHSLAELGKLLQNAVNRWLQ